MYNCKQNFCPQIISKLQKPYSIINANLFPFFTKFFPWILVEKNSQTFNQWKWHKFFSVTTINLLCNSSLYTACYLIYCFVKSYSFSLDQYKWRWFKGKNLCTGNKIRSNSFTGQRIISFVLFSSTFLCFNTKCKSFFKIIR